MKLDMPDWFVAGQVTEKDLKNAVDYGFGIGRSVLEVPNPRKPKKNLLLFSCDGKLGNSLKK